jgi:hypothetical protein
VLADERRCSSIRFRFGPLLFRQALSRNAIGIGSTVTHNRIEQERSSHQRATGPHWALPHDPRTNARPPGNGDLDRVAVKAGRERLEAVLGG